MLFSNQEGDQDGFVPCKRERHPGLRTCEISEQDYYTLLEGMEVSTERSSRDVFFGISVTAITAAVSVIAATPFLDDKKYPLWKPISVTIVLIFFGFLFGILTIIFTRRINRVNTKRSYVLLRNRLDKVFPSK